MLGRERTSQGSHAAARAEARLPEYLTTGEAAELLRVAPKTLRNKKPGLGPRWKREALVRWLEDRELEGSSSMADDVPLATSTRGSVRWA